MEIKDLEDMQVQKDQQDSQVQREIKDMQEKRDQKVQWERQVLVEKEGSPVLQDQLDHMENQDQ